jgi:TolB-like protein
MELLSTKLSVSFLTALIALLAVSPLSAEPDKPTVAVMPIEDQAGKLEPAVTKTATGYLRDALAATNEFIVIDESRRRSKLDEIIDRKKKESYKECYDESCQIPLGKALSADSILRAKVRKLGTCILSVELVDLAKEATVAATKEDFDCKIGGLKTAIDKTTNRLSQTVSGESEKLADLSEKTDAGQTSKDVSPSDDGSERPRGRIYGLQSSSRNLSGSATPGFESGIRAKFGLQSVQISNNEGYTSATNGLLLGAEYEMLLTDHVSMGVGLTWRRVASVSYPVLTFQGDERTRRDKTLDYLSVPWLLRLNTNTMLGIFRPRLVAGIDFGYLISGPTEAEGFMMSGLVGVGSVIEVNDMPFTVDIRLDYGFLDQLPGAESKRERERIGSSEYRNSQSYGLIVGYRF